jgi:F0F1-type ATP synthase membrane subunit c/vacuolar-type H+-ATPase subunit K
MRLKDHDNADLGIAALLLIAIACITTGYVEQGLIGMIVGAVAGISRSNGQKPETKPPTP